MCDRLPRHSIRSLFRSSNALSPYVHGHSSVFSQCRPITQPGEEGSLTCFTPAGLYPTTACRVARRCSAVLCPFHGRMSCTFSCFWISIGAPRHRRVAPNSRSPSLPLLFLVAQLSFPPIPPPPPRLTPPAHVHASRKRQTHRPRCLQPCSVHVSQDAESVSYIELGVCFMWAGDLALSLCLLSISCFALTVHMF